MARIYTDDERANALAVLKAEGGNFSRAAGITGINRMTLRTWARLIRVDTPISQLITKKVSDLATLMEAEIRRALGPGLDLARAIASYKDRVTAAAILTDKMQLLRGSATERTEHTGVNGGPIKTVDLTRLTDEQLQQLDKLLGVAQPAAPPEPN